MAVPKREGHPCPEIFVAPPIDEAGLKRLRNTPGVIYRKRTDGNHPRYTPWIEVNPGYDNWQAVEAEELAEFLNWGQDTPE